VTQLTLLAQDLIALYPMERTISVEQGFTLIELLVVIAVIGILTAIAIPNYFESRRRAQIAATASELRSLVNSFEAFFASNEDYPDDSHRDVPTGMERLIPASLWADETPIGGYYNWEGPNNYPYAGVSIFAHTASNQHLRVLDRMLDDGNLAQGRFRMTPNGRPTYIISE
jgi:prepilin-type N-terminal cleavage/methylation domain-containing protein